MTAVIDPHVMGVGRTFRSDGDAWLVDEPRGGYGHDGEVSFVRPYGPDGERRSSSPDQDVAKDMMAAPLREGVAVGNRMGWFRAESSRVDEDNIAVWNLTQIRKAVDDLARLGVCKSRRWTNDPDIFPDLGLGVVPFPPNDDQLYAWKPPPPPPPPTRFEQHHSRVLAYMKRLEAEAKFEDRALGQVPPRTFLSCGPHIAQGQVQQEEQLMHQEHIMRMEEGTLEAYREYLTEQRLKAMPLPPQPWVRLVDFGLGGGVPGACVVFDDTLRSSHLGAVYQGQLKNAYLVEALNAISLRPRLAQQLFHCWDVERSIYILRLFINGTWARVEIDDYVPGRILVQDEGHESAEPFCCRSEHFPRVLWPSLVEKAYAKVHTQRGIPELASGGYEAIGGGGRVEDALADLTGGVAGCFNTDDVSPDRLFVYLYHLQRDCLFVCRVHRERCIHEGVLFDACSPYIFNRAAAYENKCFVQLFTPAIGGGDAGRSLVVPDEFKRIFPEKPGDGFFWLSIYDFAQFFGTIYECRLTNSPDVGLEGMPPSRLPNALLPPMILPIGASFQPLYFEHIFANPGEITEEFPPEFTISVPGMYPCEVVASVEQVDNRSTQVGPKRPPYIPILLKVYQNVQGNYYRSKLVCKSNWLPIRCAMVSFKTHQGGTFKIIAEMPDDAPPIQRLIFRCYTSLPGANVGAAVAMMSHLLVDSDLLETATKCSLVGSSLAEQPANDLEEDLDALRAQALDEAKQCALM